MVAIWKPKLVQDLASKIGSKKVVGIVSVKGVPSKQIQIIRRKIGSQAELVVSRKSMISLALQKAKINGFEEHMKGTVGLIMSDLNPFQLEKLLDSNKSSAPAKAGSKAPFDLVVAEGDTGLPAGPLIGDIQGAGIKAKIQGGTIKVTQDSVVVKKGEDVPENVAPVLARLGIEPIDVLLRLDAAYDGKTVFTYDQLHIDIEKTIQTLGLASAGALNLSFNARIFNAQTVNLFLAKAVSDARNLMVNAQIINKKTVGTYLARADAQARALKAALPQEMVPQEKEPSKDVESDEAKVEN